MNEYLLKHGHPCVLIEMDLRGLYYRFALTQGEFVARYQLIYEDIPEPSCDGESYTLCARCHMWYMATEIGSREWCNFFTDAEWGLPAPDIDSGNVSTVLSEAFGELHTVWKDFVELGD